MSKETDRYYFTDDTEAAIVEYNLSECSITRNKLFSDRIYQPFCKIAENILKSFKFSYFEDDTADVINDVVSFMVEKMHMYDPDRGKAFGYFSVTAKNYLIQLNNNTYKFFKDTETLSQMPENWDIEGDFLYLEAANTYKEFNNIVVKFWDDNINKIFFVRRDIMIADSIIELFRRSENIENFNKKHLYVLVREMSRYKTHYITKIIQAMKLYHTKLFDDYYNTGVVTYDLNEYDCHDTNYDFFFK